MPCIVQSFAPKRKTGASDCSDAPCLYYPRVSRPESESLQQRRDGVRAGQSAAAGDVANHAILDGAERAHARLVVGDRVRIDRVTGVQAVGVGDGESEEVTALAAVGGLSVAGQHVVDQASSGLRRWCRAGAAVTQSEQGSGVADRRVCRV